VTSIPKRARSLAAVSVVLSATLLAALFFVLPQPKHLVVLPLRNVSKDPSLQPLCDGWTELLTNKLSQVARLQGRVDKLRGPLSVVPISDIFRDGKPEITSAEEARKRLGAALVMEGSLQRVGGQVIVAFALVDTAKPGIVADDIVSVRGEQLSELEDSFLSKASEMLNMHLNPKARSALEVELPKNPSAYEYYVQGRGYLRRYDRYENLDSAIEVFQKALAQDPAYALARAGLAEAYLRKYKATKAQDLISQARASAQNAMELNATLAPVHYAMGLIHAEGGEYEFAIERFRSSIKIQPDPDAYRELANAYDASNKPTQAEWTYQTAIQMRSTYWAGYRDLAVYYQDHGRYLEALPLFERVIQLTPDNYAGWANLGGLYLRLGNTAKAKECFDRAIAISPMFGAYYNLGTRYYQLKRYDEAIEMYKKAVELTPTDARGWGALGDVYRQMHSEEAMRDAYAHAIELVEKDLHVNPIDAKNWARLAVYRVATDQKQAVKDIREALRLRPEDGFVQARAASVFEQSLMRDEALVAAKAAIDLGYRADIESWPLLAPLLQDPRYPKSSPVQPSTK
jgi:tetratricopeptide (TPR) repeat protein